jgi:hypothetical protein
LVTQVWLIFDKTGDPWAQLLLGIMGAALALLGPSFPNWMRTKNPRRMIGLKRGIIEL